MKIGKIKNHKQSLKTETYHLNKENSIHYFGDIF